MSSQQVPRRSTSRSDLICSVCYKPGTLVCCTSCPRAYHANCIESSKRITRQSRFVCTSLSSSVACTNRVEPIGDISC
jgi:hypothetical protein